MIESGYYPPGAEFDPNAPYNQPSDPEEIEFEVNATVVLSKTAVVLDNNYFEYEDVDWDVDDEGNRVCERSHGIETDNCDFKEDFETQYPSIPEMLDKLVFLLEEEVTQLRLKLSNNPDLPKKEALEIKEKIVENLDMINAAKDWSVEEINVEEL